MTIAAFPTALQPAIQQGFLEREFRTGLQSTLVYRSVADPELFSANVGETVTKTRKGLKAPVTTPLNPSNNTNLDNGLTPTTWTIEQYDLAIAMYGDTIDLNTVTQHVGIQAQFLHNAYTNAVQGGQSMDRLARRELLDKYMAGHTKVTETLGSNGPTIKVDDIRGFQKIINNGKLVDVADATGRRLKVWVNGTEYTCIAATADGSNTSTVKDLGGISGTLTMSANVTVANGTLGKAVLAQYRPTILRPNGRATTDLLAGTDLFSMGLVLDGVTQLRNNAVPRVGGRYNCYLDHMSSRQLFADPDFKQLYQGSNAAAEFAEGQVIELLDVRFLPTTEAVQQALTNQSSAAINVHRPILCGAGTLVEGIFEKTGAIEEAVGTTALIEFFDGIAMVTRPPLDRLSQIIAQSWYAITGFVCPTDITADKTIIPTAADSLHKRAVLFEHA